MSLHENKQLKIKVVLQTKITHEGVTENYEVKTSGLKFRKGSALYFQYAEKTEAGDTQTTIKYKEYETLLLRNGAVKMRQLFRPSEITNGHYESIYGTLPMRTHTESIEHLWNENTNEGALRLRYSLDVQGGEPGQYELNLNYKEEA